MALVKFGGGIVKMSGTIAGNTFGRNRAGDYVRSWKKPVNPQTDRQQEVRNALAFLADYWHSILTVANRTAWNLYAGNVVMKNKLGEATYLSGYNHFIRTNLMAKRSASTIIASGPVIFNLAEQDPTLDFQVDASDNLHDIAYDDTMPWCDEDGAMMFLFQGKPQGEHVNFFDGPWRYFSRVLGNSAVPPTSPVTATAGAFQVGYNQNCWLYARIQRADGRLSEPFRDLGQTGNPP